MEKAEIDKLLLQLEQGGYLDSRYKFFTENNNLKLLGKGAFSYVYEMYDTLVPKNHYAAKVIGLNSKNVEDDIVLSTTQIQYFLSEESENVMRVIALWSMKLKIDDRGNIVNAIGVNEEGYENEEGLPIHIIYMEKLDNILFRDKYGNISLLRTDLRSEEGVIKFAKSVGKALITVHNNGFLHRDIKLENIFWDERIQDYKLGDFGIAKYIGDGSAETVVFTDGYGAPEIERQLTNSYDVTADIYSFGITLFLLLNELRFPASDGYRANTVQYSKDFIIPAPVNASEGMARIIRKMCSYNVESRYQSIEEVLTDIESLNGNSVNEEHCVNEDVRTETYREKDMDTQVHKYDVNDNKAENVSWWEKKEEELNREERKKKKETCDEMYMSASVWRMCIFAVLFALLFKALSPNADYVYKWQFWILPIAMIVETLLQQLEEFQITCKFITVAVVLFSIYHVGIDAAHVVSIIVITIGIPAITGGCAIGTGLWIAQMITGKLGWLDFLSRWDLGWIVIIVIVALTESYIILRADYDRENPKRYYAWMWMINKVNCVLIIAGIILLILGSFEVIAIPEILKHIHLVRIGIVMFAVHIIHLKYYGLLDDNNHEEEEK